MMKAAILREIEAYIDAVKERIAYGADEPDFQAVALRVAELRGAIQAGESIKDFITDLEEVED